MMPCLSYVAIGAAFIRLVHSATSISSQATTTYSYTCDKDHAEVPSTPASPVTSTWQPLFGFVFTQAGYQDSNIAEGIKKFFQRYAALGLSKYANVLLPRRDAAVYFECAGSSCTSNFTLNTVDELFVRHGEYIHFLARVLGYVDLIGSDTSNITRVFYGFTNIDCEVDNSLNYPDLCKFNLPGKINMFTAAGKIKMNLIWLTIKNNTERCGDASVYKYIPNMHVYAFNSSLNFHEALAPKGENTTLPDSPNAYVSALSTAWIVLISVSALITLVAAIFGAVYWCYWRPKMSKLASTHEVTATDGSFSGRLEILHDQLIGSGAFASVFKANLHSSAGATKEEVAVKVMRKPTHANKASFLREIEFMKKLDSHPHIVNFVAQFETSHGPLMALEYCSSGDLLTFLRRHGMSLKKDLTSLKEFLLDERGFPTPISIHGLIKFCWQISDAMVFLTSKGYIHRDLAARNVLLAASMNAKLADFGLCRYTNTELYTAYQEVGLPVRWMSPEALRKAEFSAQSDVWSFGVFMYEVFSCGALPYAHLVQGQLLEFLGADQRLEQPELCMVDIYDLMLECWQNAPSERPTFDAIREYIGRILELVDNGYAYF